VGREPGHIEVLGRFGSEIGVAFQMLDDCLDLAETGKDKPVGTDHLLGLFGAPTLCALRNDPSGVLVRSLLSPELTIADLPRIRAMIIERGGLDAARAMARERHDRAFALLRELGEETVASLSEATVTIWRML
jgi:geranylgeranyl pyrophosphate synthase